ncbi:MAG TPA: c-type cytochrome [Burkholderiales bacterium]|nr:c-type cytochrome [Burkholderiales bacterium]
MYTRSLCLLLLVAGGAAHADRLGIGAPASAEIVRAWNIDVAPNGEGLPPGRGSVSAGARIYAERCAACHGPNGEGKPQDRLTGGGGTLASSDPVKTIGSFWPYATTLFDYVRRAMPFNAPQSLGYEEVYALVAYLLYLNGIVQADAVMDQHSLPAVRMPNRDGFVPDPRPDIR